MEPLIKKRKGMLNDVRNEWLIVSIFGDVRMSWCFRKWQLPPIHAWFNRSFYFSSDSATEFPKMVSLFIPFHYSHSLHRPLSFLDLSFVHQISFWTTKPHRRRKVEGLDGV